MSEAWDELLKESSKDPIWSGSVTVRGVQASFWWQVWDTARMDLGWSANLFDVEADDEEVIRVEERMGPLVRGTLADLIMPSLRTDLDASLEIKAVTRERRMSRSGREFEAVNGKVVVRVPNGRALEPLMNSVKRFADEMGWDGKPMWRFRAGKRGW